ncbi:MAG: hypothetical protein ACKN89_16680 [Cyanobium sp.]|jgi:hypothetical protein
MPASASPRRAGFPLVVGRFWVGWVYGPWLVALLLLIAAVQLLSNPNDGLHASAIGLIGNASICFSIGCVCKISWAIARHNALRSLEVPQRQPLGLR